MKKFLAKIALLLGGGAAFIGFGVQPAAAVSPQAVDNVSGVTEKTQLVLTPSASAGYAQALGVQEHYSHMSHSSHASHSSHYSSRY